MTSEYKDLAKFAKDTNSHLFGGGIRRLLKKAKGRHYSLQALKPKTNYLYTSTKQKLHEFKKMIDQPKDPWLATRAPHSSTSHVDGQK